MRPLARFGFALGLLALAACGQPAAAPVDAGPSPILLFPDDGGPPQPPPDHRPVAPLSRIDLRRALGLADADVTGVAVDAASGERVVVEARRGLYRLDARGGAARVWDPASTPSVEPPLTDVTTLGHGVYAISTPNEGYFIDSTGRIVGHFCYVPSGISLEGGQLPPDGDQLTHALAFVPASGGEPDRIVAQPQTFDRDTHALLASHFAFFDALAGKSRLWLQVAESTFAARAMVARPDGTLLVATSDGVYVLPLDRPTFLYQGYATWPGDLGVVDIEGLAIDPGEGSLLVVDGARGLLFALRLDDAVVGYGGGP